MQAPGLRDHPFITSAYGLGGFRKWPFFANVQYCILVELVVGCVQQSPKICRRNISLVHYFDSKAKKFIHINILSCGKRKKRSRGLD